MAGGMTKAILKSAWPGPSVNNLLRAIVLKDPAQAAASWQAFEAAADFDNLTWGEFRLISLAAKKIAHLAPDSPMRPRIAGIERSIWSRSQLVIGEAGTGLRKLAAQGVALLVIKGAGRAASRDPVARGRIVNDIDIVVHPGDFERAFDILVEDGWTPTGSGSVLYHRSRLRDLTGLNLVRGEFGNLDIHATPFHRPHVHAGDDEGIWQRSRPAKLGHADVRVPSPVDTMLIAIAHGSLDAHKSSDWIADLVASIDAGVDWDLLVALAERRGLSAAAAIALGYVHEKLECPVPAEVRGKLEAAALANPANLLGVVAEARPKSDRLGLFWMARAVAKQSRLIRSRRHSARTSRVSLASLLNRPPKVQHPGDCALQQDLLLPDHDGHGGWSGTIEIDLEIELPPATRRIEFEINSATHHFVRLRGLALNRGRRRLPLRFRTRIDIPEGHSGLQIVAVPARSFNENVTETDLAKYGATPFRVLRLSVKRSA